MARLSKVLTKLAIITCHAEKSWAFYVGWGQVLYYNPYFCLDWGSPPMSEICHLALAEITFCKINGEVGTPRSIENFCGDIIWFTQVSLYATYQCLKFRQWFIILSMEVWEIFILKGITWYWYQPFKIVKANFFSSALSQGHALIPLQQIEFCNIGGFSYLVNTILYPADGYELVLGTNFLSIVGRKSNWAFRFVHLHGWWGPIALAMLDNIIL